MSPPPVVRGSRLFAAGAWMLIVLGLVHSAAVVNSFVSVPADPEMAALDQRLRDAVTPLGPFNPSAWGLVQILSISYTVLTLHAGVASLLMRRPAILAGRLRTLAALNLALSILLGGVALAFQFPPPALFALIGAVLFGWSLAVMPRQPA